MNSFQSNLKVELQEDRKTWKVISDFLYMDHDKGLIVVPQGFVTDFASVPRIPVVFELVGEYGHAAATVHDYLYSTGKFSRSECDDIFFRCLRDSGISKWRAYLMWSGVRVFGAKHYTEFKGN